jgi:DNA-binding beta-propeller fold protein YncE
MRPGPRRRQWAALAVAVAWTATVAACSTGGGRPDDAGPMPGRADRDGAVPSGAQRAGETSAPRRPSGPVLVAVEAANAVAVLRGRPLRVVARRRVATGPHNVAASLTRRLFAVTSPPADRVTLIDARGRVRAVVRVAGSPHDVRFTRDGRRLWIAAERGGRLVLADLRGRILRSLAVGGGPHDLAVSPDGRRLWVTVNGQAGVQVRSAASGALLREVRPGGAPHDLAFRPEGREVWLSAWSSPQLYAVSASGRRLGSVVAGEEPHHFAFGLGRLWTSDNGGGALVRINPRTRRVVGRTRVGRAPHHVAVSDGRVLVAVNGTGRVAVVSRRGRLLRTVAVGAGPHGIAALP